MIRLTVIEALALAAMLGCGPRSGDDGGGGSGGDGGAGSVDAGGGGGGDEFADAGGDESCDRMDLLFVIDNSPSMVDEQANLAANFPRFIEVLDSYSTGTGVPLDYRIAVTTSGVSRSWFEPLPKSQSGDDGEMRQRCGMTRRWLERGDPDVTGTFGCVAQVGIDGPGKEMPLLAAQLGFDDRVADGTNAGFRRDDALLGIVYLTDEDDCSYAEDGFSLPLGQDMCEVPDPVSDYVQFLDDYAGGRERYAIAAIAGHDFCISQFGSAKAAVRLQELVDQVGDNAVFSTICAGDLAQALDDAVNAFDAACQKLPDID